MATLPSCTSTNQLYNVNGQSDHLDSVANQDVKILSAPIAIIAIENNYDCSRTITQDQANQPAGTGYMIQLANPLNQTDVRVSSFPLLLLNLLTRKT